MPSLLPQIIETVTRHRMLERGQAAGVAVSGGADSVALLYLLVELAREWDLSLRVLHLNHRLRGQESDEDARFVTELAASLGLPVVVEDAELGDGNLEQEARRARREFFLRAMRGYGLDRVAVGHTMSDQAETVLFRLLRGSGPTGLAGILPGTGDGVVRPLIEVSREEVRKYLDERGIPWREDSSNSDRRFARNRIRHDLLPELELEWNPRLTEALAHLAEISRAEEEYWLREVERLEALVEQPPALLVNLEKVRGIHPALLRRLFRHAVAQVKGDLRGLRFEHIDAVLALASSERGGGRVRLPGRMEACRSFGWLRLTPVGMDRPTARTPLVAPGEMPLSGGCLRTELLQHDPGQGREALDWDKLPGGLEVRGWQPGDTFRPAGKPHPCKVKNLFQEARIPVWERHSWPMIAQGKQVYWTRRFGTADGYAPTPATRLVLRVWEC